MNQPGLHLAMNGHFASVGAEPGVQSYEHGVQVIDDQKEFKWVAFPDATYHTCCGARGARPAHG